MSDTTSADVNMEGEFVGKVKWFNAKAGFGFVTCVKGGKLDEDIFVHHSALKVSSEQYKYLVQGEYVNFELKISENSEHPYQANNVSGIAGGPLMCETRNIVKQTRMDTNGTGNRRQQVRPRGGGPRGGQRSGRSGLPRLNPGEKWVLQRSSEY